MLAKEFKEVLARLSPQGAEWLTGRQTSLPNVAKQIAIEQFARGEYGLPEDRKVLKHQLKHLLSTGELDLEWGDVPNRFESLPPRQ